MVAAVMLHAAAVAGVRCSHSYFFATFVRKIKNMKTSQSLPFVQFQPRLKRASRLERSWGGPTQDGLVGESTSGKE